MIIFSYRHEIRDDEFCFSYGEQTSVFFNNWTATTIIANSGIQTDEIFLGDKFEKRFFV